MKTGEEITRKGTGRGKGIKRMGPGVWKWGRGVFSSLDSSLTQLYMISFAEFAISWKNFSLNILFSLSTTEDRISPVEIKCSCSISVFMY